MTRDWSTRPGLWLFLTLVCVYMVTFGGRLYSGDGIEMWRTTVSMVSRGELALEQDTPGRTWGYVGADGRRYSPYALGLSVLQAPAVAAGHLVGSFLPPGESRNQIDWAAAVQVNVVITAMAGLLVYLMAVTAGFGVRGAVMAGLLYGLGTMAWVYSKHDFAEPLCALALAASVWMLLRFRNDPRLIFLVLAGLFNGYSFFTKYQMVIYSPILVIWILLATDVGRWRIARVIRGLAAFLIPGLAFGLVNLWINHARFGSWLSTGYGNQGEIFAGWTHGFTGLFGLLLSPGKGIFWYCPLVLAALLAWPSFHRRTPALSWLAAALSGATFLMFAPLWWWHGDWAWGPRYLLIPLPFLVLPLLGWLDGAHGGRVHRRRTMARKIVVALLLVAALGVNFLGIAVNFFFPLQAYSDAGMVHDQWNFLPGLSPLRYHAHVVRCWLAQASGRPVPDFVYRRWRDGEFTEERIRSAEYLRGPDFYFFRHRGSRMTQIALSMAGLLFFAGAGFCGLRLRRSLARTS